MLTFLLDKPKSGKTAYIMNRIRENIEKGQKTYLLVPEQQLFVSECMLRDLPSSSALHFEVIGFSRLCEIVFSEYGGVCDAKVGSGIKNLVMWNTLRKLKYEYNGHDRIKNDAKYIEMMLSTMDELRANKKTAEDYSKAAEGCSDALLAKKLDYIAAVYNEYHANLAASLGDDALLAEDKLSRLCDLIRHNRCFSDTEFFIDSFTDFTKEEFDVIKEIIKYAKSTCIAFTYVQGCKQPHFDTLRDTVNKLKIYADDYKVEHLTSPKTATTPLDVIEKHLWDFSVKTDDLPRFGEDEMKCVESYVCENEYEEAWLCALNIQKEHKNGVKYSDMAVIARNPEDKKGMLEAALEACHIPYFISEKTDLSATAPARLLLSALRCVNNNFNRSDVMNLLKTDLCGIDTHDAHLFEDYCNVWNINGSLFRQKDAWNMNANGYTTEKSDRGNQIILAANNVKKKLIPPLINLETDLKNAKGDVVKSCLAVSDYLKKIGFKNHLINTAKSAMSSDNSDNANVRAVSSGGIKEAGELLRIYDFIVSVLADICRVMKNVSVTPDMLYSAIEIMLKHTDIGSVPAINDCVTVGSAATLRVENVRVAMVLGLCEGEFPAPYADNGILTEADKEKMDLLDISISSRENKIISDELFYVYRAMTKPLDKLIISTCRSTVSGRATPPSVAWTRIHHILPDLTSMPFDLGKIRLMANATQRSEQTNDTPVINDAVETEIDQYTVTIDKDYVREFIGNDLKLSKSKITSFVQCPYKYWCEMGLELRENEPAKISYDNAGTIIHYVLENLLKTQQDKTTRKVSILEGDALIERVDELLGEYINSINCFPSSFMWHSFSRLRDLALIMAKSVMDEFAGSEFRIVGFEQKIIKEPDQSNDANVKKSDDSDKADGSDETDSNETTASLFSKKIHIPDTNYSVWLNGIIDRVDCYDDGQHKYVRVVDYKTGSHSFRVKDVESGNDVQLPAYLFTAAYGLNNSIFGASKDEKLEPAAALYHTAEDKGGVIKSVRHGFILSERNILEAASKDLNSEMLAGISYTKKGEISKKSSAAMDRDAIEQLKNTFEQVIVRVGRDIYDGNACRTPSSDACKFCKLKNSCPVANKD